jgi:hypothetical protein
LNSYKQAAKAGNAASRFSVRLLLLGLGLFFVQYVWIATCKQGSIAGNDRPTAPQSLFKA